ncbi:MAG: UMP kinase [Thermoplasmata archaeon]|nr:MAG: UMP kinase [Thermoplasmata archaeon]RLF33416.1 MAG: UMP kinase [Thermoplasmata archaeon]
METIVLSIGGSVLLPEDINPYFLKKLGDLLLKLCKKYKLFIVTGGGPIARRYIGVGRKLGFNEETLDELGIAITRVNAKLLSNMMSCSNKIIPSTTDEAKKIDTPIVVMGGTTPGHSTDMVGAELAEKTQATRFIIATNVDGIYDKDPNKYSDARQLGEISIDQLIQNYGTQWSSAGENIVIDGPALDIIKKAGIKTFVVNGKKLGQLEKAINNQPFYGTKIRL